MEFKDDEVYVGKDIGGREIEVSPRLVANYVRATGDANPIYTGRSAQGGPVAPALLLVNEVYAHPGWYLPNFFGNLHAKQEWEIFQPVAVGLPEKPNPGSDGHTTWKASSARPPCAVGSVSGPMTLPNSTTDPGHPCVRTRGNASSCGERW